jgi:ATP-binding cassette subfamily G (WHITE) protein 2 (PDR)
MADTHGRYYVLLLVLVSFCLIINYFIIIDSFFSPVGFYRNAEQTHAVHERGVLFFLLIWIFLIFTSTFAHMCIAAVETAEEGGSKPNN